MKFEEMYIESLIKNPFVYNSKFTKCDSAFRNMISSTVKTLRVNFSGLTLYTKNDEGNIVSFTVSRTFDEYDMELTFKVLDSGYNELTDVNMVNTYYD